MRTEEVATRPLTESEAAAIAGLHAHVFGPGRFARTAYRVREGSAPVSRFCRGAFAGERLVAALRMTDVTIGGEPGALLLGPLVVAQDLAGRGLGRRLVAEVLEAAATANIALVVLVGDEPYYGRHGFKPVPPGRIRLPGPVNPSRVLAVELEPGALQRYSGLVELQR